MGSTPVVLRNSLIVLSGKKGWQTAYISYMLVLLLRNFVTEHGRSIAQLDSASYDRETTIVVRDQLADLRVLGVSALCLIVLALGGLSSGFAYMFEGR